jgi:hypothetical protein
MFNKFLFLPLALLSFKAGAILCHMPEKIVAGDGVEHPVKDCRVISEQEAKAAGCYVLIVKAQCMATGGPLKGKEVYATSISDYINTRMWPGACHFNPAPNSTSGFKSAEEDKRCSEAVSKALKDPKLFTEAPKDASRPTFRSAPVGEAPAMKN